QLRLLQQTNAQVATDEALVCDRGFPLRQLQTAGLQRYVVRAPINFTARRAALPASQGRGRTPTRGALVRPLPRTYKGRTIAATPHTHQAKTLVRDLWRRVRVDRCWDAFSADSSDTPQPGSV